MCQANCIATCQIKIKMSHHIPTKVEEGLPEKEKQVKLIIVKFVGTNHLANSLCGFLSNILLD